MSGAAQGAEECGLDAEQRLFVADLTREFEWDGVHLTGGQKAAAGQTKARLLQFESLFMQTVAQEGVALTHAEETLVKLGLRIVCIVCMYVCSNRSPGLACRAVRARLIHFQISAAVAEAVPYGDRGSPAQ